MAERFRKVKPRNSNNVYMYDRLADDIVIEICTGNARMNMVLMEACWQLMHGKKELNLKDLVECSEKINEN